MLVKILIGPHIVLTINFKDTPKTLCFYKICVIKVYLLNYYSESHIYDYIIDKQSSIN